MAVGLSQLTSHSRRPELTNQDPLSIEAARYSIKAKFSGYRQLLDQKELELLSELEELEETNKPELTQVKKDIKKLNRLIDSLDNSLGTNTLKTFLEKQQSIWDQEILSFERSEKLLSHVKLRFSDSDSLFKHLIEIVPYRLKAKFRTELEPLLELEPKLGEDWFVVSSEWFSEFATSINLNDPQPNDNFEFPLSIPIYNHNIQHYGLFGYTSEPKLLHSKAWDLLLGFNGISLMSVPMKRKSFFDSQSGKIVVPIHPTKHKCVIGHNSRNNKFRVECELKIFPFETYEDILQKLSGFYTLITTHSPKVYSFSSEYEISQITNNSPEFDKYTIIKTPLPREYSMQTLFAQKKSNYNKISGNRIGLNPKSDLKQPHNSLPPLRDLNSPVGLESKLFLLVIPGSVGTTDITVISNLPELTSSD